MEWLVGGLGISETCSKECEVSFEKCNKSNKFNECKRKMKTDSLNGCVHGCSFSLDMLMDSERPIVSLSEGNFGTNTALEKREGNAPRPNCEFGKFSNTQNSDHCNPSINKEFFTEPNVTICENDVKLAQSGGELNSCTARNYWIVLFIILLFLIV